jgi:glycosyltransferase involved in cell wall biosynthesis
VQPEVLVMDDGSSDDTAEIVRSEFPAVRLVRSQISAGYIVQRNRAALLAGGEVIFSIDDDAIFTSPLTVAQTLQEFNDPRVGAVAIPYLEPRKSSMLHQQAPSPEGVFVTDDFIGTAHAVRKNVFLQLGGYREFLVHQGEEMDFCIRMLAGGRVVRLGRGDVIHHLESPRRDFRRMDFYGRRNDVLFAWQNVPMPYFPAHLLATSVNGLWAGLKVGRSLKMLQGITAGWLGCVTQRYRRQPVPNSVYRIFRQLKKCGPIHLAEIDSLLPPPTPSQV